MGEVSCRMVPGSVTGDVAPAKASDLGRDVPLDAFVAKAQEANADVIGMSALLTTTMEEQKKLIAKLNAAGERGKYKVVVGGAPATQRWADLIGADAYAGDASDGVKKIDALLDRD